MTIRWIFCGALLTISAVGWREAPLTAQPAAGRPYLIDDLGPTLGGSESPTFGINDLGQVAGVDASRHAFLFTGTANKNLGTLGGASSTATDVNRSGQVVGSSLSSLGNTKAFLYTNGTLRGLGTLGGSHAAAYAINDDGDIVGSSTTSGNAATRAFLYRNGRMTPLRVTFGGTDSVATAINEGGEVAGFASTTGNASTRAFLLRGDVQTDLGTLGTASEALGINNASEVVGRSVLASGARHAFLYSGGGPMQDLDTLGGTNSEAFAINDMSQVVGMSETANGTGTHAFLYNRGVMMDLNTVLPSGSGWVLEAATAINMTGEIAGYGTLAGRRHAFRLSPPATLALFENGALSQDDSNIPHGGVQVGRSVTFITSILAGDEGTARNVVFTDTVSGPVEIQSESVGMYHDNNGTCQAVQKTVTCRIPALGPPGYFDEEIHVPVRVTGPGTFSHSARVTADNANAAGPLTEENIGIALESFVLSASTVAGGKAVVATANLTSVAPPGGAVVRVTSSNPSVASVPAELVVQVPTNTRNFNIVPATVSQPTTVTITAKYGEVTIPRTLTVVPPALATLSLTRSTIVGGCQTATGKVTLTGSAPAAGASVRMTRTSSGAVSPSVIRVAPGQTTASFTVSGRVVHSLASGTFTASYGGVSKTLNLSVRPIFLTGLTLASSAVKGGSSVSGKGTLECAAPAGGITAALSSTNPAAATPMSSSLTFVAGETTHAFSIRTAKVTAPAAATIRATLNGNTKSAALTVRP